MYGVENICSCVATHGTVNLFDMLKRYAFGFVEVMGRIEQLRRQSAIWSTGGTSHVKVDASTLEGLPAILAEMRDECAALDLTPTVDLMSHIEADVHSKGKNYTYGDLTNHLNTVCFSFTNELRRSSNFRIANEKDKYFEKEDLFGPEVRKAFGRCINEVQAAGTCYALEQNDACAFHAMRVLESGLGALATKFGEDFSHTNWHNIIERVEAKIRKMDSSFGPDWKEQQKFYSQAATQFMFLKDAWRNHVMHLRDVPYDEGTAFSVFDHVRQVMQALAKGGLSE